MGLLNQLVRSSRPLYRAPRYLTQSRYTGTFPLGSARRASLLSPNGPLYALRLVSNSPLPARKSNLSVYEDRRLWHPQGALAWPRSMTESYPTVLDRSIPEIDPNVWKKISTPPKTALPWRKMARESQILAPSHRGFGWEDPWKMIICLKRKMRREIMHATGLAGKTGFKKPTYTQYSYVRCF